jgi:hypothetical protein
MAPHPAAMVNAARLYEWQMAAWALFALAFVVVGAVPLRDGLRRQPRVADQSPMNSTDAVLRQALGLDDGARRIAALVRTLPKDRPAALVLPESEAFSAVAFQLSALCWPRPAPIIRVPTRGDPQLAARIRATHATAAFFTGTEIPADLPHGESLGTQLRFVPLP